VHSKQRQGGTAIDSGGSLRDHYSRRSILNKLAVAIEISPANMKKF
jgi:hypothetical protein